MSQTGGWQVDLDADNEAVCAAVAHDPVWHSYFLSDLEPPFRRYTRIALARRGTERAALLVIRDPAFTHLVASGDADGLKSILSLADLPAETSIHARREHIPIIEQYFEISASREMLLMAIESEQFRPARSGASAVRLGFADLAALLDLYSGYDEGTFTPTALDGGVFFGIFDGGPRAGEPRPNRLVAAGGTHAVTLRYSVATVGSIFTRPEARGQGCATAITGVVVAELVSLGLRHINLSVAADNAPAITVYRGLGFGAHCSFHGAYARRR